MENRRGRHALIIITLLMIGGLAGADRAWAQGGRITICGADLPASFLEGYKPLPAGDVFCPLLADPKQPHSFLSYLHGTADALDTDIGAVGIGEHFGLVRWGAVQVSIEAGIFAQFDLLSDSYDLINADYLIGIPLTARAGGFSGRLRVYHQSSHLGDEFLLREPPVMLDRENLSFESAELVLSQELHPLRVYAGGEYLFNRNPDDLEAALLHAGLEVQPRRWLVRIGQLGSARFTAGVDTKFAAEQDYDPSWSVRGGIEVGRARASDFPARRWRLTAEYYTGPSPYGQFYRDQVSYYGIGMHLTL